MTQPAVQASPTVAEDLEAEVRQALTLCNGDAVAALRVTLLANKFLEAQLDEALAQVSSGFARGKARRKVVADGGTKSTG
jgi:hypothetical protein